MKAGKRTVAAAVAALAKVAALSEQTRAAREKMLDDCTEFIW